MRNKLTDLNDHLFMQLERLNDEDLTKEELKEEIQRANAISSIAKNIVSNAAVMLQGQKYVDTSYGTIRNKATAKILIGQNDD